MIYLPLLKFPKKKMFIEVIGTCPKTPKAHFGPHGPLGFWLYVIAEIDLVGRLGLSFVCYKEILKFNAGMYNSCRITLAQCRVAKQ